MDRDDAKQWIRKTCGEGWLSFIDQVFDNLPKGASVSQVYQKYAAIRFDVEPYEERFEAFLDQLADKSLVICEKCGSQGKVTVIDNWEHTRCEKHLKSL